MRSHQHGLDHSEGWNGVLETGDADITHYGYWYIFHYEVSVKYFVGFKNWAFKKLLSFKI